MRKPTPRRALAVAALAAALVVPTTADASQLSAGTNNGITGFITIVRTPELIVDPRNDISDLLEATCYFDAVGGRNVTRGPLLVAGKVGASVYATKDSTPQDNVVIVTVVVCEIHNDEGVTVLQRATPGYVGVGADLLNDVSYRDLRICALAWALLLDATRVELQKDCR